MIKTITPRITLVGIDNTEEKKFENQYVLYHGMAYNSYVVRGNEKIAVVDAVESAGCQQWLNGLSVVLGNCCPDIIVVQHMEPDHSATIADFCEKYPDASIVCSMKTAGMLEQFYPEAGLSDKVITVKEGESLDLGGVSLNFYMAPMVHWPEVMVTYCPEEGVLFSADAFGKFGSVSYKDEWINEARRYYTNIVGKFGAQVQGLLRKAMALDFSVIAPLHGPVLTENLQYYIDLYNKWSTYTPEEDGVLIAYASVYGGTRNVALQLADILEKSGKRVVAFDLCNQPMSEAVAQAFRFPVFILASVTYDGALFPPMHDFLYHMSIKGLRRRRIGLVENGSWAPVAAKMMRATLERMPEMDIMEDVLTIKSRLNLNFHMDRLNSYCNNLLDV